MLPSTTITCRHNASHSVVTIYGAVYQTRLHQLQWYLSEQKTRCHFALWCHNYFWVGKIHLYFSNRQYTFIEIDIMSEQCLITNSNNQKWTTRQKCLNNGWVSRALIRPGFWHSWERIASKCTGMLWLLLRERPADLKTEGIWWANHPGNKCWHKTAAG